MNIVQRNFPVKKRQMFVVHFLIPFFLAGFIFFLMWLAPSAVQVLLWTLVLFSFLNRLLRHFNNRIVSWLFVAVLLSVGILYFFQSEKIEKGNDQYSLQNKSPAENADDILLYFSRQRTKIHVQVHIFSNSFVKFILPGKIQVSVIFLFVLFLQLFGSNIFHIILDKQSNSAFEFFAFFVTKVYHWLVDFFFYRSVEIAFVFFLWMLALGLLQFDYAFEIALAIALSNLTPIVGIWLGGLFPLLYVQTSDKMTVQIVGVIITFAVIWLFRYILTARILRDQFGDIKPGTILVLLGGGYFIAKIIGLFLIVPIFMFARFLVCTIIQGKPLYYKV